MREEFLSGITDMEARTGEEASMAVVYSAYGLERVCLALIVGDIEAAATRARAAFPFAPERPGHPLATPRNLPRVLTLPKAERHHRQVTLEELTALFMRDGFIDLYTGEPVVYPPALLLLSLLLPSEFPYHPNWRVGVGHSMYWSLMATHDHVESLARGGRDMEENWVTCSQLTNEVKSYWSMEELGWQFYPRGNLGTWDGLLRWFVGYLDFHPIFLQQAEMKSELRSLVRSIGKWSTAAKRALSLSTGN
jgi:hypothetical protein